VKWRETREVDLSVNFTLKSTQLTQSHAKIREVLLSSRKYPRIRTIPPPRTTRAYQQPHTLWLSLPVVPPKHPRKGNDYYKKHRR
jgi:hypothetical protein